MTVTVSGPLELVTSKSALVTQVWLRAPEPRLQGSSYVTDFPDVSTVDNGLVSFEAHPGPLVMVLVTPQGAMKNVKLMVPDKATASLRECIEAAELISDGTLNALERLAQEVAEIASQIASAGQLEAWADQTTRAAQETKAAATRAETAESGAAQSEANAKTSETNAKNSENAVAGVLSSVAGSVASAATSATSARGSADRAAESETSAKTSETNALDAAERAEFAAEETIQQVEGDFATRNYVDSGKYSRQPLTTTSNVDALGDGLHPVPTVAVATALGLPMQQPGELVTTWLDDAGVRRRQTLYVDPPTGADAGLHILRRWYYNGTWQPWEMALKPSRPHRRGQVPAGATPEEMQGVAWEGLWNYDSGQAASWSIPSGAAGFIDVASSGASTLHEVSTLTTPIQHYERRAYNGAWSSDWQQVGGEEPGEVDVSEYATETSKAAINLLIPSVVDPTLSYESDHAALVTDLKNRLGTVSTGGKAAIALVADHGTTAFKDWVWAEAKARGIPFTMALAPEIHLDGKGDSRHTASNADIKQWISEGLSIASHSGDHDGATGYFDVSRQIVTSKKKLEEKLETTVDCWVQPGYLLANGSYDGFGTGQSASRYTDYYAGRLLQQNYPVITGYAGSDFVYPGNADLPVGVRRSLMERKDSYQSTKDYIQQSIDTGGKHINFIHPYAIPETSNTYVTRVEYLAFLDWLVQKRDAGDLVLLTLPELAIARP